MNDKKEETGESVRTNKLKMKKTTRSFTPSKICVSELQDKSNFFEQNEEIKH